MKFNVLLDTPDDTFGGVKVKSDFRNVLKIFRIYKKYDFEDEDEAREAAIKVIDALFDGVPKFDQDKLWTFIEWFLLLGDTDKKGGGGERVFDWEADSGRVYAAFLQVYGIDLLTVKMHWFTFKTLFDSLPSGTKLSEVIEIRSRPAGTVKDTAEYRLKIQRMKDAYSID